MYRPLAALALLWMAPHGCDYDAPLSDRYAPSNTIAGTLVTDGVEVPGDTIVLLFDAKNPPPPIGLGRPITFTTVPAADYTTDGAGVKSAPYAMPYLPDTSEENGYEAGFLVTALIDTDSNFNPFAPAIAGSTCGDWLGEHRSDIGAPLPAPVFVSGGELLDGVTVVIDREQPTQRPAFTLKEGPTRIDLQQAVESGVDPFSKTQLYRIESTSVHTAYGTPPADYNLPGPCASVETDPDCGFLPVCHCDLAVLDPCETAIWIHYVDADGDGVQDPYPSELQANNGLKNTWPRIYVEYLGKPMSNDDGSVSFNNELAGQTYEWPVGTGQFKPERWVNENYVTAYALATLSGPEAVVPEGADPFTTFPTSETSVAFSPVFRHYHAGGTAGEDPANGPFDLHDIRCVTTNGVYPDFATCTGVEVDKSVVPTGAWGLTMVTETGQTWTIPNELGVPDLAAAIGQPPLQSTDPAFETATQARYLLLE